MFVKGKKHRATLPVRIEYPTGPGEVDVVTVRVTFEARSITEERRRIREMTTVPERAEGEGETAYAARLAEFNERGASWNLDRLKAAVVGWPDDAGIVDKDGQPLTYSPEELEATLLDDDFAVAALTRVYNAFLHGAVAGN